MCGTDLNPSRDFLIHSSCVRDGCRTSAGKLESVGQAHERNDIGAKSTVVDTYRGISNEDELVFEANLPADRYGI